MRGRIVFDGTIFGDGPITGVAGSFLTGLRAYGARYPDDSVLLLGRGADRLDITGIKTVEGPRGRVARQLFTPKLVRRLGGRLFHSPVAALPIALTGVPMIATVHDLPWMAVPRLGEPTLRHRLALRRAAARAAAIVVPSAATARDLLAECSDSVAPRLHIIPHGIVTPKEPADPQGLRGPFLLLADMRPRKNLDAVRRAHERARVQRPTLPGLVVLGPGNGYVDEARKWQVLRRSRCLLQLSLHEGFGLPIAEAFAHGVPVLCSDIPSLREVAAGAALLANPRDVENMAAAMLRLDGDGELRDRLRAAGLERAAELTPDSCANAWRRLHDRLSR